MILRPSEATVRWFIQGASTNQTEDELMRLFITGMTSVRSTSVVRPSIAKDEWERLHMPVLLLIGDREIMYDPAIAIRRAKQLIPHIQAELVEGAGHFLLADQPEKVNERALQFLDAGF